MVRAVRRLRRSSSHAVHSISVGAQFKIDGLGFSAAQRSNDSLVVERVTENHASSLWRQRECRATLAGTGQAGTLYGIMEYPRIFGGRPRDELFSSFGEESPDPALDGAGEKSSASRLLDGVGDGFGPHMKLGTQCGDLVGLAEGLDMAKSDASQANVRAIRRWSLQPGHRPGL